MNEAADAIEADRIRANTLTGRPTGGESYILALEECLGRNLHTRRRGRKPKSAIGSIRPSAPFPETLAVSA